MKQIEMLRKEKNSYGGELLKTRKGRAHGRPLSTKDTMHLTLRSSKANGDWSFKKKENEKKVNDIVERFAKKWGVRIISIANVGNHLHLQIKLTNRHTYRAFIRAITSAIAMAITGASRWNRPQIKFWDYRPFTRVVQGLRAILTLRDYIRINQLEGEGYYREEARFIVKYQWRGSSA